MTTLPFTIVDAFCDPGKKFSGNPAAVCVLEHDDEISDETKANIGAQLNLSQTAFVSKCWSKSKDQPSARHFTLRWFSPTNEVVLCGHATLATSKVIFNQIVRDCENETTIYFETKYRGNLSATMNWTTGRISINFPLTPVAPVDESDMETLPQYLQFLCHPFDTTIIHSVYYVAATKYIFVRLHDECGEKGLTDLRPDFFNLSTIKGSNSMVGLIATVKGADNINFHSRFFAPWIGVNEDPVCGSAHCALTSYWSGVLNQNNLLGKMCSHRSGYVYCSINISTPDRVTLEGETKIFAKGEITL